MLKKFGDYDTTQAYGDFPTLPKGAYIMKIMGVSQETNTTGGYLKIGMDIAEGEYKDFFTNQYKNDTREQKKWGCNYLLNIPKDDGSEKDGWTKRTFKTFTEALEDSNNGYHFDWDETKFKGKLIGGLFNEREYKKNNGDIAKAPNLAKVCSVDAIKNGKYKIPEDKLIKRFGENSQGDMGFVNLPEGLDEELPF